MKNQTKNQNMKAEKKKFLSMDLAERMIRVEQNVSSAFNKYVPYNQTEYYKSLSEEEKRQFEEHMKNKGKKKILGIFGLFAPLLLIGFLSFNLTGNVVKENIGGTGFSMLIIGLVALFVILALALFLFSLGRKKKDKKYSSHIKVIDDIISKKRV
jgi:uncharacterized membrane protein YuzA (DUF378 family)